MHTAEIDSVVGCVCTVHTMEFLKNSNLSAKSKKNSKMGSNHEKMEVTNLITQYTLTLTCNSTCTDYLIYHDVYLSDLSVLQGCV